MQTVIYVDVLLCINLLLTYVLLLCTCGVLKIYTKPARMLLGSILGAIYSLVILAPDLGILLSLLLKLCMCISIVCVTFRPRSLRSIIKYCLSFFVVSAVFAGVMMLIYNNFSSNSVIYNNGNVYFNISFISLLLLSGAAYFVCMLILGLFENKRSGELLRVQIYVNGIYVETTAIADTGNSVQDANTGKPVAIVMYDKIKPLFDGISTPFFCGDITKGALLDLNWQRRITLIHINGVTGADILPAFRPDCIIIHGRKKKIKCKECVVAVTKSDFGHNDYSMLLHPAMLSNRMDTSEEHYEKQKSC